MARIRSRRKRKRIAIHNKNMVLNSYSFKGIVNNDFILKLFKSKI